MTCCSKINLPGGGVAIVCSRGRRDQVQHCCGCGGVATLQCDWKVGKGLTCDSWICSGCAKEVGPDKHLCPRHQLTYKDWLASRPTPQDTKQTPTGTI